MKLVALLAWYNEPASWLVAAISSLNRIGVDHVVAMDGAYALYPDGRPRSDLAESHGLLMAADAAGIGITVHQPATVWCGGEVEKRTRLFDVACALTEPGDWLFVIDADEVVSKGSPLVRDELAEMPGDVLAVRATLEQWWGDPHSDEKRSEIARLMPHPTIFGATQTRFFRRLDNMRVDTTHFTFVGEVDGESYSLRGDGEGLKLGHKPGRIENLTRSVVLEHRDMMRDMARRTTKLEYYRTRDALRIEAVK